MIFFENIVYIYHTGRLGWNVWPSTISVCLSICLAPSCCLSAYLTVSNYCMSITGTTDSRVLIITQWLSLALSRYFFSLWLLASQVFKMNKGSSEAILITCTLKLDFCLSVQQSQTEESPCSSSPTCVKDNSTAQGQNLLNRVHQLTSELQNTQTQLQVTQESEREATEKVHK